MNGNAQEWKPGTDALALCSLCGGEYPVDAPECPECHVSLSIVRRCPECSRLVSAQHTRCVYCRTAFTHEPPTPGPGKLPVPGSADAGPNLAMRRLRATVVSVGTFVIVFTLGIFFLHILKPPAGSVQTVAKTHALRAARLRTSPSYSSSIAGMVSTKRTLDVAGIQQNSVGRWMVLRWKGSEAYIAADRVKAPRITHPDGGVQVLRFFMEGMRSPTSVEDARRSVDLFAKAFPHNPDLDQLRWVLAERMRTLARSGGAGSKALRQQAEEQYQQLANGNGPYATRARAALQRSSNGSRRVPDASSSKTSKKSRSQSKPQTVQIISGNGIQVLGDTTERHQEVVLTQLNLLVRTGQLSGKAAGSLVRGSIARQVEGNGVLAIPEGAPCTMKVLRAASDQTPASIALLSVEVDHHSYAVHSAPLESQGTNDTLSFHLDAPLVIVR